MATTTGPVAVTRDAQAPDSQTWQIAVAPADAARGLILIDARGYESIEFQFMGTITAGTIIVGGGLAPNTAIANMTRLARYDTATLSSGIDTPTAVYGARREMLETNLPPFVNVVTNAAWNGTGNLLIRLSR